MAKLKIGVLAFTAAGYTGTWFHELSNQPNGEYPNTGSVVTGLSNALAVKHWLDDALINSATDSASMGYAFSNISVNPTKFVLVLTQKALPAGGFRVTRADGTQTSPSDVVVPDTYSYGHTQDDANSAASDEQIAVAANAAVAYLPQTHGEITPVALSLKLKLNSKADMVYQSPAAEVAEIIEFASEKIVAQFAAKYEVKNTPNNPTPATSNNSYYKMAALMKPVISIAFATQVTEDLSFDVMIDELTGDIEIVGLPGSGLGAKAANDSFAAFKADKSVYDRYLAVSLERSRVGLFIPDLKYTLAPASMTPLSGAHLEIATVWWAAYQNAINATSNKQSANDAWVASGSELSFADWKAAELAKINADFASDDSSSWWDKLKSAASSFGGKIADYATNQSPTEWVKAGTLAYVATAVGSTFDKKLIAYGVAAVLALMAIKK